MNKHSVVDNVPINTVSGVYTPVVCIRKVEPLVFIASNFLR